MKNQVKENKIIFKRIVEEGLNQRNMKIFDELYAANFIHHDLPPGTPQPQGIKDRFTYFFSAFPDLHFTFEGEIAEDNRIAGRGYFSGTHKGEFNGIPPTGKAIKVNFMDAWLFENGKVEEYWGQFDLMSLMQQLGALPTNK
jgi:steroid delta-isomerase-like uncharacterized protein